MTCKFRQQEEHNTEAVEKKENKNIQIVGRSRGNTEASRWRGPGFRPCYHRFFPREPDILKDEWSDKICLSCATWFFKRCSGRGPNLGSFLFSFILSHKCRALDHSATAPPCNVGVLQFVVAKRVNKSLFNSTYQLAAATALFSL